MIVGWITQGPLSVCETRRDHRVFPSPSKIPYGGFSPVRLQTRSLPRPSPGGNPAYTWHKCVCGTLVMVLADKHRNDVKRSIPTHTRPEALGSPAGYVVRPDHSLLWPHPSHSRPSNSLFSSSVRPFGGERFPNLSCLSVRACRPQDPGEPDRCVQLLLPDQHWSSPVSPWLDIHHSTPLVLARFCNEAESGSLALRPARWLALHQQGLLLPSFRQPGHPEPTSVITTRANSQFPRPDFHRQDKQPYGLRTKHTKKRA